MVDITSNIGSRLFGKHFRYALRYAYIVPRVIYNYFKLLVLKQPVLRGVEFAITYKCNSKCAHCSCETLNRGDEGMLTVDEIKKTIDDCVRLGALQINLTGGEALYHPQILPIAEYAGSKKVVLSVATNGVLLSSEMARKLAKRKVRIISLAIDSADREEHDDRHNSKGCYDKMLAAIRNAKEVGMEVFLCTICTPENMENGDMWKMIRFAEELEVTITLNIACSVGAWDGEKLFLSDKATEEYKKMLALPHVRWEGGSNYIKEGCPAGVEKIYFSPYGDTMPCPRVHLSYGTVREEPLETIWKRMIAKESPFHASNYDYEGCPAGDDPEFIEKYVNNANADGKTVFTNSESTGPLWFHSTSDAEQAAGGTVGGNGHNGNKVPTIPPEKELEVPEKRKEKVIP